MSLSRSTNLLRVGEVELDLDGYCVLDGSKRLRVEPKAWDLLMYFVRRPGQLISKQELVDQVWGGAVISDAAVSQAVLRLRSVLGDSSRSSKYIQTVPRRGYRFVAQIRTGSSPTGSLVGAFQVPQGEGTHGALLQPPQIAAADHRWGLVGRDEELGQLLACWAQANTGKAQIVYVCGEAGLGKTALISEFVRQAYAMRSGDGFIYTSSFCAEDVGAQDAYLPLFELFSQLRNQGDEVLDVVRECAPAWVSQDPLRQYFGTQGSSRGTGGLVREAALLVRGLSKLKPCLLVIEDLQWCDRSSLDVLRYLVEFLGNERVMIVMSHRLAVEGLGLRDAGFRAMTKKSCTSINLRALTEANVGQLVAHYVHPSEPNFGELCRTIWRAASGNPLHARALVEFILEHVSLDELPDPSSEGLSFSAFPLPDSIQDAISLKLESLSPPHRQLIAVASAIGMRFTLAELLELKAFHEFVSLSDLQEAVTQLETRGFLKCVTGDCETIQAAEFGHALNRQVVYGTIAVSERRALHRTIGERIESAARDNPNSAAVKLGYHYAQACVMDKAIEYLAAAARQMTRLGADQQAGQYYAKILELVHHLPRQDDSDERQCILLEVKALVGYAAAMLQAKGALDLSITAERVRDLAAQVWPAEELFELLLNFCHTLFMNARADLAEPLVQTVDDLAMLIPKPIAQVRKNYAVACLNHMRGDLVESAIALEKAGIVLEQQDVEGGGFAGARLAHAQLGAWNALFLGAPVEDIQQLLDEASAAAALIKNPATNVMLMHSKLSIDLLLGRVADLEVAMEQLVRFSSEAQQWGVLRATEFLDFWLKVQNGKQFSQLELKTLWDRYAKATPASKHPTSSYVFVEACIFSGYPDYALGLAEQLAQANETHRCRRDTAELMRLQALGVASLGDLERASAILRKAVDFARRQGNVLWRQRAAQWLQVIESHKRTGRCLTEAFPRVGGRYPTDPVNAVSV